MDRDQHADTDDWYPQFATYPPSFHPIVTVSNGDQFQTVTHPSVLGESCDQHCFILRENGDPGLKWWLIWVEIQWKFLKQTPNF